MLKYLFFLTTLFIANNTIAQLDIIPTPVHVTMQKGMFAISASTVIVTTTTTENNAANFLNDYLNSCYGFRLKVSATTPATNFIRFTTPVFFRKPDHEERYTLNVSSSHIEIQGDSQAGTFYGMQTLLQLLPITKTKPLNVACVNIEDYPRFAYRGMHLDVSRHFFSVEYVKRYIDFIALHKMNKFHWHLTDDQGWRIEIKKYPRLTSVGSCRNGTIIGRYPGTGNDSIKYCGYYTQEQIKEVVQYAAERYITVIPEIDIPGHSLAILTAYPELSTTPDSAKQVAQTWGINGVFNNVLEPSEKTFSFLQDVFDEIIPLFSGPYIHIGGDECSKRWWKASAFCQNLMKQLNLKDEDELQSYFIGRIEKYINSKGKKIIGWDEILEGGVAPNGTVMSWQGEEGGLKAAKLQHDVVMTPGAYCYFDHSQSNHEDSVTIGSYIPVEKVYSYDPIPAGLDADKQKYILGAQGNLWTEYITNPRKVEYMLFPRMTALSEVLWTPKVQKDSASFEKRLLTQFKRYELWKANYSKTFFDLQTSILPTEDNNGVYWKLTSKLKDVEINYAQFSSNVRHLYRTYPIRITSNITYQVFTWKDAKQLGNIITQTFSFNKATGKKIILSKSPTAQYSGNGGAFGLINGAKSETGIASTEWLGWKSDVEMTIDLCKVDTVHSVSIDILQRESSWIWAPSKMEVSFSVDGKSYSQAIGADKLTNDRTMSISADATRARFVKIKVYNNGKIAENNPGAGNIAWLFIDEVEVR